MNCRASSDDLGCYEFSGGFSCIREAGHEGIHQAQFNNQLIVWGDMERFEYAAVQGVEFLDTGKLPDGWGK